MGRPNDTVAFSRGGLPCLLAAVVQNEKCCSNGKRKWADAQPSISPDAGGLGPSATAAVTTGPASGRCSWCPCGAHAVWSPRVPFGPASRPLQLRWCQLPVRSPAAVRTIR